MLTNSFSQTVTKTTTLSLAYTNIETYDWNTSQTVSVTIGSETKFNVPLIGSTKLSLQVGYSATFSKGGSNSSGVQAIYQEQVSVPVPPGTAVGVQIVAYQQDALVPFTYTGIYHFADGTSVPVSGTGEFEGVSTGVFDTRVYPISDPSTTLYTIAVSPNLMTFEDAGQSVEMTGDNGNDDFIGTTGNDTITTGTGTNKIDPGSGNDLITSEGNDTIYAGAGSDTVFAVGQDLAAVGTGTLSFVNGDNPATVIGGSTGTAVVNGGAGGGLFAGGSGDANIIVGGSGAATIFGSSGPDLLFAGGSNPDLLAAGSGNETLSGVGSSGNNVMWAGAGTDLMGGGSGNETFFAGQGSATIIGGSGVDLFAFVNGQAGGSDVISGFNPDQGDRVDLQGYGPDEVQNALAGATVANGSTTITLSDHTTVLFVGVTDLTASAFV
jgi:Ca2+-binding RTX toxin-like protein